VNIRRLEGRSRDFQSIIAISLKLVIDFAQEILRLRESATSRLSLRDKNETPGTQ
jgi:hypothetical protein